MSDEMVSLPRAHVETFMAIGYATYAAVQQAAQEYGPQAICHPSNVWDLALALNAAEQAIGRTDEEEPS